MTDDEQQLLEFEETHPRNDRSKEAAISETFGHSWVRYQQKLLRLTKDQEAVAAYPMVIRRVANPRPGLRARF